MNSSDSFFRTFVNAGDPVYNPYFGKGVVVRHLPNIEGVYVDYASGARRLHTPKEFPMVLKRTGWILQDPVVKNNKVEGHVEIFTYDIRSGRLCSLVKPFYKTPSGRLRFSFPGMPYNPGISPSSLGKVQYLPHNAKVVLYVLQDDPKKEKHKASMWRTVAHHHYHN